MAAVGYASGGRFGMDDFPFDHSSPSSSPSPFDLSDYILFDEGPVQCPLPASSTGVIDPGQPPQGQFLISSSSKAAGGQFSMTTNQFATSTSSTAAASGQFSMASQPAGSSSSSRSNRQCGRRRRRRRRRRGQGCIQDKDRGGCVG
ncbi:putative WRKY transcription factor 50 [Iris pallida]|uniref:WRKY transcription factor 50 n=1 Tax=Iris pallida TaxID=29817 RepID=A0AAX6F987_IRIPA|nr:putative WRKY transcription factor 50 [Iris pallida]